MRLNSLTANFEEFRTFEFKDGLNIVLAERSHDATKTDSRNGLGKTTTISLIDFCLGANIDDRLEHMQGNEWAFTLQLTTNPGATIRATRSPDSPKDIHLSGDLAAAGLLADETAIQPDQMTVRQQEWTTWLGQQCFTRDDIAAKTPTFRSLIRHLVRYRQDSFIDPFQAMAKQSAQASQAENAYLLNLDWRFAEEWAELKKSKAAIRQADTTESSIDSRIADLESQLVRFKLKATEISENVSTFTVLPQYRDIEQRVKETAEQMKELGNANLIDSQQLEMYESQALEENTTESFSLKGLFDEAKYELNEAVVRRVDEAKEFQQQVSEYRASYLEDEIRTLKDRIKQRDEQRAQLDARQREDMRLLKSGGALDVYYELQKNLAVCQTKVATVEDRIKELNALSDKKMKLKSQEFELTSRTKRDLQQRFELRAGIIARFGQIIETLYGEPASLQVSQGKTGFQFNAKLPKTGSGGVHLMAILAYDIALAEDLAKTHRGPGFIIHDSAILADVDERQAAKAIEIAAESATRHGYQHLLTVNSDNVPWAEFQDRQIFDDAIILTLHDGDPTGSVLGQRLHQWLETTRAETTSLEASEPENPAGAA